MKLILLLLTISLVSVQVNSQEFLWATSYDINNSNEVASISVDTNGYIFICGVHDAPVFLPYTGNCYIQKADNQGIVIWTEYMEGGIQIGDMKAAGSSAIIIGQSNGPFIYQGEEYGSSNSYFMFVMKIDSLGSMEWFYMDETKFGANTNISVGKLGKIALHIRGQYNLGDWLMIMEPDGTIINTKQLSSSETLVIDMAYYNGKVYLNGGFNGIGSVVIDTIVIQQSPLENVTFVMALDEELVAEWISIDSTINNRDGRIVVSNDGVFAYQEVLEPPFNIVNTIKKFSFSGQLLAEIEAPVFSNAISLYPDMVITTTRVGLFTQNAFDFNSHKVMLFDFNLNVISEKLINGPSDLYSGQISNFGEDIYVAHVHSGDLDFGNELNLSYSGSGKRPYIAKIGENEITDFSENIKLGRIHIYPNPANKTININLHQADMFETSLTIMDMNGRKVMEVELKSSFTTIDISHLADGVYFSQAQLPNGRVMQEKIIIR